MALERLHGTVGIASRLYGIVRSPYSVRVGITLTIDMGSGNHMDMDMEVDIDILSMASSRLVYFISGSIC